MNIFAYFYRAKRFQPAAPGLLTIHKDTVIYDTDEGRVFSTHVSNISAIFTIQGDLVITLNDTGMRYRLMYGANAGGRKRAFSSEQIDYLEKNIQEQQTLQTGAQAAATLGAAGLATSAVNSATSNNQAVGAAGVGMQATALALSLYAMHKNFKSAYAQMQKIEKTGLPITYRSRTSGKYIRGVLLLGFVVLAIFFSFVVALSMLAGIAEYQDGSADGSAGIDPSQGLVIMGVFIVMFALLFIPAVQINKKFSR